MFIDYQDYRIRAWQPADRQAAIQVISTVLAEYGLTWDPQDTDQDAFEVETYYWQQDGAFWVVEHQGTVVGTAGFYPINRGEQAVEIRKMYLLPQVRGQGLGRFLLQQLEAVIQQQGYRQIWIETASVLATAVKLYESAGYRPETGVETPRCDRVYVKDLLP